MIMDVTSIKFNHSAAHALQYLDIIPLRLHYGQMLLQSNK